MKGGAKGGEEILPRGPYLACGGGECRRVDFKEGAESSDEVVVLELGTDSYTEVVPAPQGGRLW